MRALRLPWATPSDRTDPSRAAHRPRHRAADHDAASVPRDSVAPISEQAQGPSPSETPSEETSASAPSGQPRRPYRVLFVCQGNIARSAAAEILARAQCPPDSGLEFASAGTGALVGSGVAEDVDAELEGRGLDVSGHVSQQLTGRLLEWADLVLPMQAAHRRWILDEWPAAVSTTFLLHHAARLLPTEPQAPTSGLPVGAGTSRPAAAGPDPARWLRAEGGRALPEDDIADPFRQGRPAAAEAVGRVEESLQALLPRLQAWVR